MQHFMLKKMKLPTHWVVGLALSGLLGVIAVVSIRNTAAQPHLDLQTVNVDVQDLRIRRVANGVVKAVQKTNLSPNREGTVYELYVEEGDWVEKGQVIARMDQREMQAQVDQYRGILAAAQAELDQKQAGNLPQEIAEAQADVMVASAEITQAQASVDRTQDELQRYQGLAREGAVSQNELNRYVTEEREARATLQAAQARLRKQQEVFDRLRQGTRSEEIAQAQARVAETKAQLQYYETQLENTEIRAPFSGVITRLFAQEGDFVTPTTSVSSDESATSASLAELSKGLEIEVRVPEANIAQLQVEQAVEIHTDAYPEEIFEGQVRLIAPRATKENNVTFFNAKVAVNTGQDRLKLGMNVKLDILGEQIQNALVVPLATIITRPNGETGVYVLDDANQVAFRSVTVGVTAADQIQILQGVSEDEQILLSPPDGQTESPESPLLF